MASGSPPAAWSQLQQSNKAALTQKFFAGIQSRGQA